MKIGFVNKSKRGKHLKLVPPDWILKNILLNNPRFIMIPYHRELKIQKIIIQELRDMGGEKLINLFLENL